MNVINDRLKEGYRYDVEVPERLLLSAIMNTQDIMSRHSKFYA